MRVALVTPSLDQGAFLGAAIDSVLAQSYPDIDYLVVDGGSEDDSLEVLRSYGDRIRWISEPDRGQVDAIRKGFAEADGEVLGWLNADDLLEESAVEMAVEALGKAPEAGLVYGDGRLLDEAGRLLGPFAEIEPFSLWRLLYGLDYILQPAAFFRRSAYDAVGGLDSSLRWAMDWDLWIRLATVAEVEYLPREMARARVWAGTKTAGGGWRRQRELRSVARRHTGRAWTPGIRLYALDALRQQLARGLPPILRRMADTLLHRLALRVVTRMACYPDGWLGPDGCLVLPRRWGRARVVLEAVRLPADGELIVKVAVDGEPVRALTFKEPGSTELTLELPARRDLAFCTVDLVSSYWFRTEEDPRRLSLVVRELAGTRGIR